MQGRMPKSKYSYAKTTKTNKKGSREEGIHASRRKKRGTGEYRCVTLKHSIKYVETDEVSNQQEREIELRETKQALNAIVQIRQYLDFLLVKAKPQERALLVLKRTRANRILKSKFNL